MKKIYFLIILLTLATLGLEIANIRLSDKLASDGMIVRKIQENIQKIDEENQILNTKILELTSFETISSRAGELGFVAAKEYLTLKNQTKLTYNQ